MVDTDGVSIALKEGTSIEDLYMSIQDSVYLHYNKEQYDDVNWYKNYMYNVSYCHLISLISSLNQLP